MLKAGHASEPRMGATVERSIAGYPDQAVGARFRIQTSPGKHLSQETSATINRGRRSGP